MAEIPMIFPPAVSAMDSWLDLKGSKNKGNSELNANVDINDDMQKTNLEDTKIRDVWPEDCPQLPPIVELFYHVGKSYNEFLVDGKPEVASSLQEINTHKSVSGSPDGSKNKTRAQIVSQQAELWRAFAQCCTSRLGSIAVRQNSLLQDISSKKIVSDLSTRRTEPEGDQSIWRRIHGQWQLLQRHIMHRNWRGPTTGVENAQAAARAEAEIQMDVARNRRQRIALGIFIRTLIVLILLDASIGTFVVSSLCFIVYVTGILDPIIDSMSSAISVANGVSLDQILGRLAARQRIRQQEAERLVVTESMAVDEQRNNQETATNEISSVLSHVQSDERLVGSDEMLQSSGAVAAQEQAESPEVSKKRSSKARALYQLFVMLVFTMAPWWTPDLSYIDEDLESN